MTLASEVSLQKKEAYWQQITERKFDSTTNTGLWLLSLSSSVRMVLWGADKCGLSQGGGGWGVRGDVGPLLQLIILQVELFGNLSPILGKKNQDLLMKSK